MANNITIPYNYKAALLKKLSAKEITLYEFKKKLWNWDLLFSAMDEDDSRLKKHDPEFLEEMYQKEFGISFKATFMS